MSNDFPRKRKFTSVIDLTTRGQEVAKAEVAHRELSAVSATTPAVEAEASFSLSDAPEIVQRATANAGWDRFMPVQEKTLPIMLAGRDLIVQSKTGSGKTGAFLLPLFASLDASEAAPQALVLTPTRELARQIYEEFQRFSGPDLGFRAALVYGGVAYGPQQQALRGGNGEGAAHIVIGTPGRILDLLERRTFTLDRLRTLVLDEADEMLSMGFLPAMRKLHRYLPARRQSAMFSATMPPAVRSLAQQFLETPQFLALAGGSVQIDALSHRYYAVDAMEKDRALIRLIEMENPESAIIFANTKREVEYLAKFLRNYGHDAGEISGDLNQSAREAMMARIRAGNLRFLIATDVAARGIDISDLTHVVQYDVPVDPEYYVHRAGRTARAGKTGVAITLVSPAEKAKLLSIFRRYDLTFEERMLPTDEEVAERVRERLTVLLEDQYRETRNITRERIGRFEPLAQALAQEEPHLLALLLDALYHESLHRAPQAEVIETSTHRGQEQLPREERGRERRKGRKREHEDLYDAPEDGAAPAPAPRDADPASERPAPPEPRAPKAIAAQPSEAVDEGFDDDDTQENERTGEQGEGGQRKKRRRKKRKGGAANLQPEGQAPASDSPDEAPEPPAPTSAGPDPTSDDDADEASSGRRRRGRGGRGRGNRTPEAQEGLTEAPPAPRSEPESRRPEPAPAAPAEARRAEPTREPAREPERRPERGPRQEAPTAQERTETPAQPSSSAAKRAAVPAGPYRIQGLRAFPETTLRAIGEAMEIAESPTAHREDLVYRILEVQAERESSGRGRRTGARPAKPAPARTAPAARTPEPPRAPSGRSTPAPPAEGSEKARPTDKETSSRRGRGRRGASEAAPQDVAPQDAAATPTPEAPTVAARTDAPAAPKTPARRSRKATPAEGDAPAVAPTPAAEMPGDEKPKRSPRRKAAPDVSDAAPATAAKPSAVDEAPKPRRRRKADAAPLEPVVGDAAKVAEAEAPKPKPRSRKKATDAPASDAAAAETPTTEAPKPKPRSRKKATDAPASDAPQEAAAEAAAAPRPRARRVKKDEG